MTIKEQKIWTELIDKILPKPIETRQNYNTYTTMDFNYGVELEIKQPQVTNQDRITQLKHCKNYLERQNIERNLNRLYKERR